MVLRLRTYQLFSPTNGNVYPNTAALQQTKTHSTAAVNRSTLVSRCTSSAVRRRRSLVAACRQRRFSKVFSLFSFTFVNNKFNHVFLFNFPSSMRSVLEKRHSTKRKYFYARMHARARRARTRIIYPFEL